jgi:transcriptional regulator with XRE-family HTH domain
MTMNVSHDRIGERIHARRVDLDKTLREVADLAGISHTHLGRIERGLAAGTNRFHIAAIAAALKCPVDFLTGTVVPGGPDRTEIAAATYDSVRALIAADLEFDPAPTCGLAPIEVLADRVTAAIDMRQRCNYAELARRLPALTRDLYDATTGPDRMQALAMLARIAEAASFAVRYLGDPRSATIASDRARQAAVALGDPVMLAFSDWARAHSALGCGLHDRSVLITSKALRELDGAGGNPAGRLEMLGMLYLTLAFSLVGAGRFADAQAPLDEAGQLAEQTGETDTLALMFGPTNVKLWKLAIFTDGGDPVDALPLLSTTDPMVIPSASRQVCFYTDAARLLARAGYPDRAVTFFETAERIAPQRMHGDPIVVESVRGLVDTVHRKAVSTRLRGLASRAGVPL